ncbi:MAG: hypothetical protein LBV19_05955 [Streptococcaceae bacterium]|jgi:hypothetical protein|nr:hypothetical protein [Streptococcaceae bacterium]
MVKKKNDVTESSSQKSSEISEASSSASEAINGNKPLTASKKTEDLDTSENEMDKSDSGLSQIFHEQTLDFANIPSELTVEEVQVEAQILEDENLSAESPLDRYVRKHREEVENAKNALGNESAEPVEEKSAVIASSESVDENIEESFSEDGIILNSGELDSVLAAKESDSAAIIEENAAQEGELIDTTIFPAPTLSEIYASNLAEEKKFDSVAVDDEAESEIPSAKEVRSSSALKRSERFAEASSLFRNQSQPLPEEEDAEPADDLSDEKKSRKKFLIIGLAAIAVLGIASYAGVQIYNNNQAANRAEANKAADKISAFNKDYAAFFTDSSHKALKNANFDKLSDLGKDLNAIPTSNSKFTALQTQYNNLASDIAAVKSVNSLFDKPVIVDGNLDSSVSVNKTANIPSVSSKNTTLNDLLQKAINLAKTQQTDQSNASSAASSAQSAAQSARSAAQSAADNAAESPSSVAGSNSTTTAPETGNSETVPNDGTASNSNNYTDNTTAAGSVYSQNPTGAAPNNSGSRVPIQSVDPNAAAFQWSSGVLDLTISTMQSRGYISGNNYILLPVAIDTAGEGWYNIYRPDGSYLFSINCKTGFWAGTGGKYPNLPATF